MAKLLKSNSKTLMNNFLIRSPSTSADNIDNEPFLLVLYLCKYGEFEPNEIEVTINNLYMEIKGEQKWRMADGGADSRTFTLRHVLPNNVDLNSMYCRLVDQNLSTLVISAKKTPGIQPKVDYTLAFNESGVQYLKSYNLNKENHDSSIRSETTTTQDKTDANNDATKMLFNLISKSSTKNKSKLFTNIQGQENLNLANNLRNQTTTIAHQNRIRLNIDQLMNSEKKDASKKKKSKKTRSKSKKKDNQNDDKSECTDDKQKELKQKTPKKDDNQTKKQSKSKESMKSNVDKIIEESLEKLKLLSANLNVPIMQALNDGLEQSKANKTNEKDNQTKKQTKSKDKKSIDSKDNLVEKKDKNEMANLIITDLLDGNFVYGNDIVKEQKNSDDQTSSSSSISLLNECTNHLMIDDQTKSIDKDKSSKKEKHVTIIDDYLQKI